MEIQEIWRIARRQWPVVITCTALALLLFASWSLIRPTTYAAHERLIVSTSGSLGTAVDAQSGEEVAILRVAAYERLITGPAFLTRVAGALDHRYSPEDLAAKLEARSQARIPVIDLTVTDTDPQVATDIVKVVAKTFAAYAKEIENPSSDGSLTSVGVVGDAPDVAEKGNVPQNLTIAAIVGFLVGMAIATVRERTRRVVDGIDDLPVGVDGFRGRVVIPDEAGTRDGRSVTSDALLPVAAGLLTSENRPAVVVVSSVDDALSETQVQGVAAALAAALKDCGSDAAAFSATVLADDAPWEETAGILPVAAAFDEQVVATTMRRASAVAPVDAAQREIDRALLAHAPEELRGRLSLITSIAVMAGGALPTSVATAGLGRVADLLVLLVTDGVSARSAVAEAHALATARGIGVHGYLLCAPATNRRRPVESRAAVRETAESRRAGRHMARHPSGGPNTTIETRSADANRRS
ncbi:MAG: hypothetical protein QM662_00315 [Gordonia sp. (in: high G+C Gram-positive bacteria)]